MPETPYTLFALSNLYHYKLKMMKIKDNVYLCYALKKGFVVIVEPGQPTGIYAVGPGWLCYWLQAQFLACLFQRKS
jgi:hypothetical protein